MIFTNGVERCGTSEMRGFFATLRMTSTASIAIVEMVELVEMETDEFIGGSGCIGYGSVAGNRAGVCFGVGGKGCDGGTGRSQ